MYVSCIYRKIYSLAQLQLVVPGVRSFAPLRSKTGSPGCTPPANSNFLRMCVRVHSAPGHDNFSPMRATVGSPGSTPHAHGQARPQRVRIRSAFGHDQFYPLRSKSGSPGCTPLSSTHTPGDLTSNNHPPAHISLVTGPGHDVFHPLHLDDASPGGTPFMSDDNCMEEWHVSGLREEETFHPLNGGDASPGHTPYTCTELTPGMLQSHMLQQSVRIHSLHSTFEFHRQ